MSTANLPNVGNQVVLNKTGFFSIPWARYMNDLFLRVGGGSSYNLGGRLITNNTAVPNTGTSETDLITYSIQKNTLKNNGDILSIVAYGTTASNSNNKTIKLVLGSTVLFTTGAVAFNNKPWCLRSEITRTDTAKQQAITTFHGDFSVLTNTATFIAGTEDFTTPLTLKCTGTSGTASNDVIQKGLIINMFPAG